MAISLSIIWFNTRNKQRWSLKALAFGLTLALIDDCFAGGDLGQNAWRTEHNVPPRSVWVISWTTPYEISEIRPLYDLRLEGAHSKNVVMLSSEEFAHMPTPNIYNAISPNDAVVLALGPHTTFNVANDMLDFQILKLDCPATEFPVCLAASQSVVELFNSQTASGK